MSLTEEKALPSTVLEVSEDGLATLVLAGQGDRPFILDRAAVEELEERVEELGRRAEVRGLMIVGAGGRVFCAGADVDAISGLTNADEARAISQQGQELFAAIEDLPFPVVALIHGACLGGGLELALAAHMRLVSDDPATRLGLPEVRLGIVPAWGGTTRLPGIVGLRSALPLLLTGKTLDGRRAERCGLAIECVPGPLLVQRGRERLESEIAAWHHGHHGGPVARQQGLSDYFVDETSIAARAYLRLARKRVLAETRGHYPAPLRLLDILSRGHGKSRERRFELEREALGELVTGPVCKNLVSIFRRSREKDRGGLYARALDETRRLERIGIVGAGVMGAGIAAALLQRGLRVRLVDAFPDALGRARKLIQKELDGQMRRRRLDKRQARNIMDRLMLSLDHRGLAGCDLIIECVPEVPSIKQETLTAICRHAPPDAIIATNTSSLSVEDLARHCENPQRFAGLHFFNPAPRMPLVEVVRAPRSSNDTLACLLRFAKDIGKTPVLCADRPAFVVNRLLAPYLLEAVALLEHGASIEDVDRAARGFGLPMGPFELMDTVGLDVTLHVCRHLAGFPEIGVSVPVLIEGLVDRGDLGVKTGRGFYRHRGKSKKARKRVELEVLDPSLRESRFAAGLIDASLCDRLLEVLMKEAGKVLEERVVDTEADLDLATIYGMGFPPWTGGLASWKRSRERKENAR